MILLARFRLSLVVLVAALAYGTLGYVLIEDWSPTESVYMTVITLSTVGFREVRELDTSGQLFTVSLILLGLVAVLSAVSVGTQLLASGELGESVNRRRSRRRMRDLADHYVVCGYGRVGRAAVREFAQEGVSVVVVDREPAVTSELEQAGVPHLTADPSDETVLIEAGIARARGLVCAVDSDEVNVYITITARALNPALTIVARAARRESVDTLRRAGADRVVSPYVLSGSRMAFLSLRPAVVDFLDMVTVAPDLRLEEIAVGGDSPLSGRTVGEVRASFPGATVLALRHPDAELVASPADVDVIGPGDLVVALGRGDNLEAMLG